MEYKLNLTEEKKKIVKEGLETLINASLDVIKEIKKENPTSVSEYTIRHCNLMGDIKSINLFTKEELEEFDKKYFDSIKYHPPKIGNIIN
ncbi:MAG: hypothetical protein WC812_04285 [Candidatus Pacearchaeota archaeon]|jgi:hypothetical protein